MQFAPLCSFVQGLVSKKSSASKFTQVAIKLKLKLKFVTGNSFSPSTFLDGIREERNIWQTYNKTNYTITKKIPLIHMQSFYSNTFLARCRLCTFTQTYQMYTRPKTFFLLQFYLKKYKIPSLNLMGIFIFLGIISMQF
jgi:hypothetical protein